MYDEGLVRFATEKYSTKKSALKKRFIHLTNYSVNKKADNYKPNNIQNESTGEDQNSKWNLTMLRKHFAQVGINTKDVFNDIKDAILKTLIAIEPHIVNNFNRFSKHKNTCFEVYGFDVLLDYKLKPWILEVNVCPSLSSSSKLDKKIKTMMLSDAFHCIGIQPYDRKKLEKDEEKLAKSRLLGKSKSTNASKSKNIIKEDGEIKDFKQQIENFTLDEL